MALDEANFIEDDYNAAQNKTWNTSFSVDGLSYATNLFWQPLQNTTDPILDVEQAAENILEGADLFCIKEGKAPQFGICISSEGYKKNQNVAAVSISSAFADWSTFVAVFKVDAGWWYVCVRNDIILSDGDMLFANEKDAQAQFESMLAVPDWNKKIAPAEWGIENTEDISIAEVISSVAPTKLKKIKALRDNKLKAVFAISAILGLWIIFSIIDAVFLTPTIKPIVTVAPKKVKPIQAQVPVEVAPWETLSDPSQIMESCYETSKQFIAMSPPGWTMSTINCTQTDSSIAWLKNVGTVAWVKKVFEDNKDVLSAVSFSDNGDVVTASINYPKIKEIKSQPKLTADEAAFEINKLFQSLDIRVEVRRLSVKTKTNKVYNTVGFSFEANQNPIPWSKILTKYSGLYINNIQYNPASRRWKYEGALYVL